MERALTVTTHGNFPHVQSQDEEEMRLGFKEANRRGGRLPKFYRAEVEAIRADKRPTSTMAQVLGVGVSLIEHVRGIGRYRKTPYVPRDEIDRRDVYKSSGDPINDAIARIKASKGIHWRAGRGFSSGRGPLTPDDHVKLLTDPRPAWEVANEMQLTVPFVQKYRRDNLRFFDYEQAIKLHGIDKIVNDQRDYKAKSVIYRLPAKVIVELERRCRTMHRDDIFNGDTS